VDGSERGCPRRPWDVSKAKDQAERVSTYPQSVGGNLECRTVLSENAEYCHLRLPVALGLLVRDGPHQGTCEIILAARIHPHVVKLSAQNEINGHVRGTVPPSIALDG